MAILSGQGSMRLVVLVLVAVGVCPAVRAASGGGAAAVATVAVPKGYRVREVRWDPVLQRSWAVLESVDHPERPTMAVLPEMQGRAGMGVRVGAASGLSTDSGGRSVVVTTAPPVLVVHAGDQVLLRSEDANLRLQLTAVAEENGGVGDRVRVRLLGGSFDEQGAKRVTGIVRGPGEVEMDQ
jgi:hypothetical protein